MREKLGGSVGLSYRDRAGDICGADYVEKEKRVAVKLSIGRAGTLQAIA
jgi:hypothetical protein